MVFAVFHLPSGREIAVNITNIMTMTRFDEEAHQTWLTRLSHSMKPWENTDASEVPRDVIRKEAVMVDHIKHAHTNIHLMGGDIVSIREYLEDAIEISNAALRNGARPEDTKPPRQPEGPGGIKRQFG